MMHLSSLRSNRRLGVDLGACLVLTIATAALVAGCGSSSSSKASASKTTGRTVQVLATVRRGDLVESVTGMVQLKGKTKTKVLAQVIGQNASQVAVGQSARLVFFKGASGVGQGQSGQGFSPPAGQGSQSQNGQGFVPPSGQGGQSGGLGALGGKTVRGTVTSVSAGSNGSVTATIAITKLPAGVTAKYRGIVQIQVKVLASNVLIIPTAAIKGSGSNATVQLLAGGKTSTQSVVVGQQTQADSEITSGLAAGQNVVYTRTFSGPFPGASNGPSGGQGFPTGAPPSGFPSGGSAGGA
jgi:hypothetical protein